MLSDVEFKAILGVNIVIIAWSVAVCLIKCKRDRDATISPHTTPTTVTAPVAVTPAATIVFKKPWYPISIRILIRFGYRAYTDFIVNDLTEELKTAILRCTREELHIYEVYAIEHNKSHVRPFIRSIIDGTDLPIIVVLNENV